MADKKKSPKKSKSFGSFADLAKAMGVEGETPDEPVAEPGWTFKRAGEEEVDLELETQIDVGLRRRPRAFGPMEHGPLPYRNIDSEEMQLLKSFRVRTLFPADVAERVAALPDDPDPSEFAERLDLRDQLVFTIDGADAKDYDDAISMNRLPGGNVELGVHIADVGHYVTPGTPLDDEAMERGTSIYVADQVVPMLPEKLDLAKGSHRRAHSKRIDLEGKRRARCWRQGVAEQDVEVRGTQ